MKIPWLLRHCSIELLIHTAVIVGAIGLILMITGNTIHNRLLTVIGIVSFLPLVFCIVIIIFIYIPMVLIMNWRLKVKQQREKEN